MEPGNLATLNTINRMLLTEKTHYKKAKPLLSHPPFTNETKRIMYYKYLSRKLGEKKKKAKAKSKDTSV